MPTLRVSYRLWPSSNLNAGTYLCNHIYIYTYTYIYIYGYMDPQGKLGLSLET